MRHVCAGTMMAVAALYLNGCAGGMSQAECSLSDWHAVGYEDGSTGRPAGAFSRYRKSCAEHGVAADFAAYKAGHEAGLKEYCQPSRGYQEGSRGAAYAGVCPAETEARFLEAYDKGRALYDLKSGLRATDNRLRANRNRIKEIELELTDKGTAALAETTTREERARLIVETKQLVEERARLTREMEDLKAKRQTQEEQLAAYRAEQVSQR